MYDLQQLENSYLRIDQLIYEFRQSLFGLNLHKHYQKYNHNKIIFHSYITLPLVTNKNVREVVQKYISELIVNKKEYGYLYFLNTQKLMIPLHLNFNAELVIDPINYKSIIEELHSLASLFSCPIKDNLYYEITLIEILYFLTILVNPTLNWITVDFVLRGNRTHDYLISFKDRIIPKTWPMLA